MGRGRTAHCHPFNAARSYAGGVYDSTACSETAITHTLTVVVRALGAARLLRQTTWPPPATLPVAVLGFGARAWVWGAGGAKTVRPTRLQGYKVTGAGPTGYWTVRNSFGQTWGFGGDAFIAMRPDGARGTCGMYRVRWGGWDPFP
jgi:hypothetical protein